MSDIIAHGLRVRRAAASTHEDLVVQSADLVRDAVRDVSTGTDSTVRTHNNTASVAHGHDRRARAHLAVP